MSITTPIAINLTTVFGYVFDDDGTTAIQGATIKFTSNPFMQDDNLVAINETVTSDVDGRYQAALPRTAATGTIIKVDISWTDSDGTIHEKNEQIVTDDTTPVSVQAARATITPTQVITGGPQGPAGPQGPQGAQGLPGSAESVFDLSRSSDGATISITTAGIYFVDCDTGDVTIQLPDPVGNESQFAIYKTNTATNTLNITTVSGVALIGPATTIPIVAVDTGIRVLDHGSFYNIIESSLNSLPHINLVHSVVGGTVPLTVQGVYFVDPDTGPMTLTLPSADTVANSIFFFKNDGTSGNDVTVNATGGDFINGATSVTIPDGHNIVIHTDADNDKYSVVQDSQNPTASRTVNGLLSFTAKSVMDSIAPTGLYDGGILSVGTPNTTFSITDGEGYIVDNTTDPNNPTITPVSWTGKTNIAVTNLATNLITFVGIDSGGNVIQQTTRWTAAESRDCIILGVVVHVNKTIVDTVNQEQHSILDPNNQLGDLIEGIGFFNVDGNVYSANGSNLNIDKSSGIMFGRGINYFNNKKDPHKLTLAGLTALTFQYRFSNGDNGVTGIAVDPDNLDDGAGGLTALANNKWSVQRIYSFTSNNVKIQRGVTSFDSKEAAIAGIASEPYVTEPSIAANGMLRGFIIVKKGATNLSNANQAAFIEASKFQSVGGASTGIASTLQSAYDNSTPDPEILTDSTNGAVTIRRGSAADTDDVLEVQNNAGTKNFSVTGEGETIVGGQAYSSMNTLSDAATIATDCSLGNVHEVTLTDNRTLGAPTNLKDGATYIWIITQDGTGSRTLAYNAVFKFPGGTAPTLSTAANSVDILSGVSDGTNIYCNMALDFS